MTLYFNQLQDILKVIIEDIADLLPNLFLQFGNENEARNQT